MNAVELLGRAWEALTRRVDSFLFGCALALVGVGLVTLFSAADQSMARVTTQLFSFGFRAGRDVGRGEHSTADARAHGRPARTFSACCCWSGVALFGVVVNHSRAGSAWGSSRIQPSELMKIATPLMLAWYSRSSRAASAGRTARRGLLTTCPALPRQAAAGPRARALLIAASGFNFLFLAGLRGR